MRIPNRAGMSAYALKDGEYEDSTITEVAENDEWYSLTMDSSGIGMRKSYDDNGPHGMVPKVGDTLRIYGGFGHPARGMALNGTIVFWHTPQEQQRLGLLERERMDRERRAKFEKDKPSLDAQYAALPEIFRQRIDRFRANNPDFRWEYESYELFCCTEAVKLATYLGSVEAAERYTQLTRCSITDEEKRWYREWEEQKAIDRAAGISQDHSGNTHDAMVSLAFWYLKHPESVVKIHGALSPLVGSFAYGDMPPDQVASAQ